MARIEFLGCSIDTLSLAETVEIIDCSIFRNEFLQHVVINVAKLVNMQRDSELAKSVNDCDIVNIDGMGVVIGARMLGHHVPERVAGIDLFHALLELSEKKKYSVYLLGAEEEVLRKAIEKLKISYPKLILAGYHHGYFWDNEERVVEDIRSSNAQLLFVAITSPKKENFINKWKGYLGVNFVMGVGGSFDVVAGKVSRAPVWMQRYGLEWFYRVLQEPKRMWRRYLFTNMQFAFLLLKALFAKYRK